MMVQGVYEETTRAEKSVDTFGGSGESIIRCVKRTPAGMGSTSPRR